MLSLDTATHPSQSEEAATPATETQSSLPRKEYRVMGPRKPPSRPTPGLALVKKLDNKFLVTNRDFCSTTYLQSM